MLPPEVRNLVLGLTALYWRRHRNTSLLIANGILTESQADLLAYDDRLQILLNHPNSVKIPSSGITAEDIIELDASRIRLLLRALSSKNELDNIKKLNASEAARLLMQDDPDTSRSIRRYITCKNSFVEEITRQLANPNCLPGTKERLKLWLEDFQTWRKEKLILYNALLRKNPNAASQIIALHKIGTPFSPDAFKWLENRNPRYIKYIKAVLIGIPLNQIESNPNFGEWTFEMIRTFQSPILDTHYRPQDHATQTALKLTKDHYTILTCFINQYSPASLSKKIQTLSSDEANFLCSLTPVQSTNILDILDFRKENTALSRDTMETLRGNPTALRGLFIGLPLEYVTKNPDFGECTIETIKTLQTLRCFEGLYSKDQIIEIALDLTPSQHAILDYLPPLLQKIQALSRKEADFLSSLARHSWPSLLQILDFRTADSPPLPNAALIKTLTEKLPDQDQWLIALQGLLMGLPLKYVTENPDFKEFGERIIDNMYMLKKDNNVSNSCIIDTSQTFSMSQHHLLSFLPHFFEEIQTLSYKEADFLTNLPDNSFSWITDILNILNIRTQLPPPYRVLSEEDIQQLKDKPSLIIKGVLIGFPIEYVTHDAHFSEKLDSFIKFCEDNKAISVEQAIQHILAYPSTEQHGNLKRERQEAENPHKKKQRLDEEQNSTLSPETKLFVPSQISTTKPMGNALD